MSKAKAAILRFSELNEQPHFVAYDSHKFEIPFPERVVLKVPKGKQIKKVNLGSNCYLRRSVKGNKILVDPDSLCNERSRLIQTLTVSFSTGEISIGYTESLSVVFRWIDDSARSTDLIESVESARVLYRDYSIYLQQLTNNSNVAKATGKRTGKHASTEGNQINRSIAPPAAARYQCVMALIIAKQHDLSYHNVRCFWSELDQHFGGRNLPVIRQSESELSTAFAAHCIQLESLVHFLRKENKILPLRIPYSKIGQEDVIFWSIRRTSLNNFGAKNKWQAVDAVAFHKDGTVETWEAFVARHHSMGTSTWELNKKKPNYDRWFSLSEKDSQYLINTAIRSFCHILLAGTGMNPELLSSIDFTKAKLDHSINAMRLIGIKHRAGGLEKEVLFPSRYLKYWRLGLEAKKMAEESTGDYMEVGLQGISWANTPASSKNIASFLRAKSLFPAETKNIKPTDWRTFKSTTLLDVTDGDIELSSKIMGHSENTSRRHYAFKKFEDSAKELSPFLEGMAEWAYQTVHNPLIPARMISGGQKTVSGHCDADVNDAPTLIEGFDENGPKPACEAHTSCFFCEHYGLHADIEDIRNLLSIRAWLRIQTQVVSRNVDEHMEKFLPIIERVDVILEQFSKRGPEAVAIFNDALKEVKNGNYTIYWKNKIDAMIDAGAV